MRKMFATLSALSFVVALAAPALAKTETVKGQIVDEGCYKMGKSNTGVDHKMPKGESKDCAVQCAKNGNQMALLTSDGKLYELTGGLAANKNEIGASFGFRDDDRLGRLKRRTITGIKLKRRRRRPQANEYLVGSGRGRACHPPGGADGNGQGVSLLHNRPGIGIYCDQGERG